MILYYFWVMLRNVSLCTELQMELLIETLKLGSSTDEDANYLSFIFCPRKEKLQEK